MNHAFLRLVEESISVQNVENVGISYQNKENFFAKNMEILLQDINVLFV